MSALPAETVSLSSCRVRSQGRISNQNLPVFLCALSTKPLRRNVRFLAVADGALASWTTCPYTCLSVDSHEKVYIPAMKQFVLEFKNLAGQQKGVASITTARELSVAYLASERAN